MHCLQKTWRVVLFVLLTNSHQAVLLAEELEDRQNMVTDPLNQIMFGRNLAMLKVTKSKFSALQLWGSKTANAIGNPGSNNDHLQATTLEKDQMGGVVTPLGGAAFGLDYSFASKDQDLTAGSFSTRSYETFRTSTYRMHYILDLESTTALAFSYRYKESENHVLGGIFVNENDATDYLIRETGFLVSFYHRGQTVGFGLYHSPAMRGKSEIAGEQKIASTPSTSGLNLNFVGPATVFGIEIARWNYKKDDISKKSTSPVNQRSISLRGLDIDQMLYNTQRLGLGLDIKVNQQLKWRLSIYRQDAVMLSQQTTVPGDAPDRETAFKYYGAKTSLHYSMAQYFLFGGLVYSERKIDSFRDNNSAGSWIGYGLYADYKAQEKYMMAGAGFDY